MMASMYVFMYLDYGVNPQILENNDKEQARVGAIITSVEKATGAYTYVDDKNLGCENGIISDNSVCNSNEEEDGALLISTANRLFQSGNRSILIGETCYWSAIPSNSFRN